MSHTSSTTQNPVDQTEWDQVLAQLRADGFTPIESIKVTRAVLHVSLGEAKQIVHQSTAWANDRADFEQLQDWVTAAASQL